MGDVAENTMNIDEELGKYIGLIRVEFNIAKCPLFTTFALANMNRLSPSIN